MRLLRRTRARRRRAARQPRRSRRRGGRARHPGLLAHAARARRAAASRNGVVGRAGGRRRGRRVVLRRRDDALSGGARAVATADDRRLRRRRDADADAAPLSAAAVAAAELGGGPSSAAAGAAAAGGASEELRPLLAAARALLHSRNSSVVLSAASLLLRLAPASESACVAVPICRLVRSPTAEVACAALASALSLAASRPSLLAPHCRDFFVWAADAPPVANAKLAVLPKLITKETVEAISAEVAIQMRSPQPELVRAAARAAADVAAAAPGRADACVRGLLRLLSSGSEEIVAEAVSAVRTLLQAKVFGEQQPAVVATVAALLPSIALPRARASVLWCVGNHCEQLPLVAPDVLRTTLARFADEAPAVRLQALDLAARCAAHGLKKSSEMLGYALDLGKYDPDHDVRARARWIAGLSSGLVAAPDAPLGLDGLNGASDDGVDGGGGGGGGGGGSLAPLAPHAMRLLCPPAPAGGADAAAAAAASAAAHDRYTLGSLSALLGRHFHGHQPLPPSPDTDSDPALRRPAVAAAATPSQPPWQPLGSADVGGFYDDPAPATATPARDPTRRPAAAGASDGEYSYYSDEDDDDAPPAKAKAAAPTLATAAPTAPAAAAPAPAAAPLPRERQASLLDDTSAAAGSSPGGAALTPLSADAAAAAAAAPQVPPPELRWHPLLDFTNGNGLGAEVLFSRQRSLHVGGEHAIVLRLRLRNSSAQPFASISLAKAQLSGGQTIGPFAPVSNLPAGAAAEVHLHVDFAGSRQPVRFHLATERGSFPVEVRPTQGELLVPAPMDGAAFDAARARLGGMHLSTFLLPPRPAAETATALATRVLRCMHASVVPPLAADAPLRFAGAAIADGRPALLVLERHDDGLRASVHAEDAMGGPILLDELKAELGVA